MMTAKRSLELSFPEPDIALLTLDAPDTSANLLSSRILEQLEQHLNDVDKRGGVAGLIILSGKPGMFIAGADLKEFVAWIDSPREQVREFCRRGQSLFGRLASGDYVTVAAIDGICVGGGAELAIWCDRRIMTQRDKTSFGFPEVKLGLFPGWGGTARAPRMIGLANAVELITGGDAIDARTAAAMGLADDVVPPYLEADELLSAALRMIRAENQTGEFRRDRDEWSAPIAISDAELGFLGATASAYIQGQTKGHYPAPMEALELMLGAASADVQTACQLEAENFAKLFGTPVNRALLNIFFLQDRNKKDPGVPSNVSASDIRSAAIVGAGIMGQGIAAANVKRSIPVALSDARPEALAQGVQGVLKEVSYNKQTKSTDADRALEMAPRINATTLDEEICAADIVIEAIIENSDAKKQLFARLEPRLATGALLCSNTSTIPITKLAADLTRPERFCGLHFFNPVRRMPLVEVIRGAKTSDATVATAVAYAKSLGKSPIVVEDGPGFLVNRLLMPYMNEAALLLSQGATINDVERAAKSFGMPMGPITLFDVVGLDTCLHAGKVMLEAFPDRTVAAEIIARLVQAGRLGQKSGRGFFDYSVQKKGRGIDSTEVSQLIAETTTDRQRFSVEQITQRLFFPMLLEATRVLDEGLVRDPRDVDLGLVYGIGFPPFKGGLLYWADSVGAQNILDQLRPYIPLGNRFEPTDMLKGLANSNHKFYDVTAKQ